MVRSTKRLVAILAGALCIVVGVASLALANESGNPVRGRLLAGLGRGLGMGAMRFNGDTELPALAGDRALIVRPKAGFHGDPSQNPRLILAYIAGKTGIPLDTLYEEYEAGKALEEIAEAYGVDWAEIEDIVGGPRFPARLNPERLERAIESCKANIERLMGRMEAFQEKLPEYEARIAEIEDETLREFAKRHLELMKERHELGDDHLSIMEKRLELLEDELDYAKSR